MNERFPEEPDYTNVVFIDEYPELKKRVWLRRLNKARKNTGVIALPQVIKFPERPDPDDIA